ncbi:lasso peptide biosynthesis PqqD family chaperone [Kitasatospora sp. NPDC059327]|uniref:lasso peptide biosynthesis PqqD family chaperone n=1 Tax=Kitasatospora sp. NPDC059327 TaxID=3346803 RepID=UPI003673EDB0
MAVKLRADVTLTETGTGGVLLDERASRYFQLNRTGVLILRTLIDGRSPDQAAEILAERYPVTAEQARTDVDSLHRSLTAAGLITE